MMLNHRYNPITLLAQVLPISLARLLVACVLSTIIFSHIASAQEKSQLYQLTIANQHLQVEIASTEAQRQQGLMHRTKLPEQQGMLFIFPDARRYCMWMRNTLIPLSVAFIDRHGQIINIADMAPQSETSHCAEHSAVYALEVNQHWFVKHQIKADDRIRHLPHIDDKAMLQD